MGKVSKKKQQLLEVRDTCINCEETIALDQRYCSFCGGKRMYNRLTWRNLFEDFVDRFLNIENAFLKTFIAMFRQPEDVIIGYTKGMRKKYLPAFSYFAIAITVAGFSAFILKTWFMEDVTAVQKSFMMEGAAEEQQLFIQNMTNWMMDYQSVVYFLSIPLMVVMSKIVFWKQKSFNWVEHVVIYLYAYAHIAIVSIIIGLLLIWNTTLYSFFSMTTIFIQMAYIAYVLKRVFALDSFTLVLKTVRFGCTGIVLTIPMFLIGVGFAVYGMIQSKNGNNEPAEPGSLRAFFEHSQKVGEIEGAARVRAEKLKISIDSARVLVKQERDTVK